MSFADSNSARPLLTEAGLYQRSASENGGIFGGGPLVMTAVVN